MKKSSRAALSACAVVLLGIFARVGLAQTQVSPPLVIEGGTLIDGNGAAPVRDSVVVIQGNKITAVSRKGQVTYPPNAKIINAGGKFVLPGLFDSQVSNSWYFGEAQLLHGVTSTIDVGTGGEPSVPYRDAAMHGKIIAPRGFTGISRFQTVPTGEWAAWTGLESILTPSYPPKSIEHLKELVKARLDGGADFILFQDGSLPLEYYKAAIEQANKAGKPVFTRAYGPILYPKDAALVGSAALPHSSGIGAAIARNGFTGGRDDRNELDRYVEMDDAKAKELIQVLVDHKVALVPTFVINFPGYPKDWAQFAEEGRKMFTDPNLLTYYPASSVQSALASYVRIDQGAVRERRMKGYQNAMRFHKMFVEAGGHLLISGNTNDGKSPGLNQHHEMQIMAEAGLTPMQIIQGSTKWPAELIRKLDILGTVEAGKLADVIVVDEDPLQSVKNLEKISTVIFNGNVLELAFHPWYSSPFSNVGSTSPTVDGLPWVVALKNVSRRAGQDEEGGGARAAGRGLPNPVNSPQPAIETIEPCIVTQGSPMQTVIIKGFNFTRKSAAFFNGVAVPYRAVSATELQITLDENLLRTAGRFDLVVKNPEPLDATLRNRLWGNGTSNAAHLIVNYRYE